MRQLQKKSGWQNSAPRNRHASFEALTSESPRKKPGPGSQVTGSLALSGKENLKELRGA